MYNKNDDWDDSGCLVNLLAPLFFIAWLIMCAIAAFRKNEEQLDKLCPFPEAISGDKFPPPPTEEPVEQNSLKENDIENTISD